MQEKTSADHLLYVSLKYTKTTDVILNLIERWKSLIEHGIDKILEKAKKKRKITSIPTAPKLKIEKIKKIYKKNKAIVEATELLEFFKRIKNSRKIRENEFRKNVTLKVFDKGKWTSINLEKLKEYNEIIERFIREVRQLGK